MRALRAPVLGLAALVVSLCAGTAACGRPGAFHSAAGAAAGAGRRRSLLQCQQCPDPANTTASCAALDLTRQQEIRNSLIFSCSTATLATSSGTCCDTLAALTPADWQETLVCLCSADGLMPGLAAFVMPSQVLAVCGCTAGQGGNASANASTTSPAPPGAPPAAGPQSAAAASASASGAPAGPAPSGPAATPAAPAAPGQFQAAAVIPSTPAGSVPGSTPGSAIVQQVLPSGNPPGNAGSAPGKPAGTPGVPGGGNHPGPPQNPGRGG